ncbi:MAG: ribosome recycling factor [Parcubacteria group bacterium]|nr:ribosome recycling factor [Parcubacteria group bacterium]
MMNKEEFIKTFQARLDSTVNSFKEEMLSLRTGRPTPKLVENITVEAYNQKMTVKQLGSITVVPPREIDIMLWDAAVVNAVAKAIETSPLGVTANVEGNVIRINLPVLTEERKKELIKLTKAGAEEQRIKIRSARDDANKKIKEAERTKEMNEDEVFGLKEKVQKAVDAANAKIEEIISNKAKEIEE